MVGRVASAAPPPLAARFLPVAPNCGGKESDGGGQPGGVS
jgi:hypothetical protein